MRRKQSIILSCTAIVMLAAGGAMLYLKVSPLAELGVGDPNGELPEPQSRFEQVFWSVSKCAHKQKDLFSYVEAYRAKHGQVPDNLKTLIEDDLRSLSFSGCPLGHPYVLHPENYGKAGAVFISESQDSHPNTLKLWLKGIRPGVQTMGDGRIFLFEEGKIATIQAKKQ